MGTTIDIEDVRRMSVNELMDELARGEEDLEDVIEAELQRRTLVHLSIMTWTLLILVTLGLIGLIIAALALAGVFRSRPSLALPRIRPKGALSRLGSDWMAAGRSWCPLLRGR